MDIQTAIERFLKAQVFAVTGASQNRKKYGNKVLRCYLQNDRRAIPINPGCSEVEGQTCYLAQNRRYSRQEKYAVRMGKDCREHKSSDRVHQILNQSPGACNGPPLGGERKGNRWWAVSC